MIVARGPLCILQARLWPRTAPMTHHRVHPFLQVEHKQTTHTRSLPVSPPHITDNTTARCLCVSNGRCEITVLNKKETKRGRELEIEKRRVKERSGGKSKCESDRPDCLATEWPSSGARERVRERKRKRENMKQKKIWWRFQCPLCQNKRHPFYWYFTFKWEPVQL